MKYLIFSLFVFLANSFPTQTSSEVSISFLPMYDKVSLSLNNNSGKDSIQIETLKFYISKVELYDRKEKVFAEENSFHLIDAASPSSLTLNLNIPENVSFTHLKFNIGIDSLTNVSGAFGGDLDPTNGMYWTWQSGYINFKLEGKAEKCPSRKNLFQFHLGGYQAPFNTLQNVSLEVADHKIIKIEVVIDKLLENINLEKTYQVMSPNQAAVEIAELLPSIFSISK